LGRLIDIWRAWRDIARWDRFVHLGGQIGRFLDKHGREVRISGCFGVLQKRLCLAPKIGSTDHNEIPQSPQTVPG
jgi:hypothetical protein